MRINRTLQGSSGEFQPKRRRIDEGLSDKHQRVPRNVHAPDQSGENALIFQNEVDAANRSQEIGGKVGIADELVSYRDTSLRQDVTWPSSLRRGTVAQTPSLSEVWDSLQTLSSQLDSLSSSLDHAPMPPVNIKAQGHSESISSPNQSTSNKRYETKDDLLLFRVGARMDSAYMFKG